MLWAASIDSADVSTTDFAGSSGARLRTVARGAYAGSRRTVTGSHLGRFVSASKILRDTLPARMKKRLPSLA